MSHQAGSRVVSGVPNLVAALLVVAATLASTPNAIAAPGDYLDEFNTVAYDGSDGTLNWQPTPWTEIGEATDASAGMVQVAPNSFASNQCLAGDCLRLGGYSGGSFGAERPVALAGATSATLSYTWGLDTGEGYYAQGVSPKVQVWDSVGNAWVNLHSLPPGTSRRMPTLAPGSASSRM